MLSLYDPHLNIIEHFMDDKGMTSPSDVVRQALTFMHDKMYPNYIFSLSPAAKLKQRQVSKIEEEESVTEEDFAISKGLNVFETEDGSKIVMYRGLGHTGVILPLEGIREWLEKNPYVISETLQDRTNEPDEQYFERNNIKQLLDQNKVINREQSMI